jgi:hypothetical protein
MSKEGKIWSETSRAADIVKALSQGIIKAGGDPDADLMRLVSQPSLADAVGNDIMKMLFTPVHWFTVTLSPEPTLENTVMGGNKWEKEWRCSDGFGANALKYFSELGAQEIFGKTFNYYVMKVNREIYITELCHRLKARYAFPYPQELPEIADQLPQLGLKKVIHMPWHQYRDWSCGLSSGAKKFRFTLYNRVGSYRAGSLFLVKEVPKFGS